MFIRAYIIVLVTLVLTIVQQYDNINNDVKKQYCDAVPFTTVTSKVRLSFDKDRKVVIAHHINDNKNLDCRKICNDATTKSSNKFAATTRSKNSNTQTLCHCKLRGGGNSGKTGSASVGSKKKAKYHSVFDSSTSYNSKSNRRACSFYIWNAPSALLHKWCCHLQRDCIYEGRGGKKFVRIQPGSMLQLLYPCTRYSVDKCLLCGGTFQDHLILWWSKHFYTPFDRYLDRVQSDGVALKTIDTAAPHDNTSSRKKRKRNNRMQNSITEDISCYDYGYHRRYVLDITSLLDTIKNKSHREKKDYLRRAISERYQSILPKISMLRMEQRDWRPFSKQPKIKYIVPSVDENDLPRLNSTTKSIILLNARMICLDAIDKLLDIQEIDYLRSNRKLLGLR